MNNFIQNMIDYIKDPVQFNVDVLTFVIPAAMAASCAFMLPVATPPNAIIFSSGEISIKQMARAGLILNLVFIVIVVLMFVVAWQSIRISMKEVSINYYRSALSLAIQKLDRDSAEFVLEQMESSVEEIYKDYN